MALVVETGSGASTSDSYASLDTASTYATSRGLTFAISGADEPLAEQALRRATVWIDSLFRGKFPGQRLNGFDQALEWPRISAFYQYPPYDSILSSEVPTPVIQATIEAAVREKATPHSLSPDVTPGKIQKSVRVEGAVAVEYAVGSANVYDQRPFLTVISGILAPLLLSTGGTSLSGRAERV